MRRRIVQLHRQSLPLRAIARRLKVALKTVQRWVARAGQDRLDRVDWRDRSSAPRRTRRLAADIEDRIVEVRALLAASDLGECGARAIRLFLRDANEHAPSLRSIGRILERRGLLDGQKRVRRPPPPRGWYLPDLAEKHVELDSFDVIEGLTLPSGDDVHVLTGVSLHGRLTAAWPHQSVVADIILDRLVERWRSAGLPAYAQFDNDTRFQGPHNLPDTLGRVIRLCLSLGVTPVFAPPRETGFQAPIESFNGLWQAKVWNRFLPSSLEELRDRSRRYTNASTQRHRNTILAAPVRLPFPDPWKLNLQAFPKGRVIFLRRTNDLGHIDVLGHSYLAAKHWLHRLVRVEVHFQDNALKLFGLRRSQPREQSLLSEHVYHFPKRKFREISSKSYTPKAAERPSD